MEDDDDEVILKNSALYTHLLANGLNDFESAEVLKIENLDSLQEVLKQNEMKSYNVNKNAENLNEFVNIILNSNLVFYDDIIIIKNFIIVYSKSYSVLKTSCLKLLCRTSATISIYLLWPFHRFEFRPLIYTSLSLTPLGLFIVELLHHAYVQYKDNSLINEMIRNMKDLSMILHKCVKFIQESEVLTYYSVSQCKIKLSFGIPSGNENCRGLIMFQLRQAVYDTLQSIILSLKTITCSLVKNHPIKKSAESMNFYLSFLTEEELHCPKEQKEKITVDQLQKMKYIYLLLQSEFLKRLCLNMNSSLCINCINKYELFRSVKTISGTCARLHSQIKDVFHIFYILENRDERKIAYNSDWIYKEAYTKICSVSHNFQLLLKKSRQIEEHLEKTRLQNDHHDKMISTLNTFSEELLGDYKRSKSVIEDFYDYVMRQKPKISSDICPSIPLGEESKTSNKIIVPVGNSDFNPSCPDEVFIGISTPEKKTEEKNQNEDFIVTKKCSKLLISELKLALKGKAQEWKERERVALKNKNLFDKDDNESISGESDELENLKATKTTERLSSESDTDEFDADEKFPIRVLPTRATFAEKIAFASSKWALKSEEFLDDSEDEDLEN